MKAEDYKNRCGEYSLYNVFSTSHHKIALKAGKNGMPEIGYMFGNKSLVTQKYVVYEVYPNGNVKHVNEENEEYRLPFFFLEPIVSEEIKEIYPLIHFHEKSNHHFAWYKKSDYGIAFYKSETGEIYGKHFSNENLKNGYVTLELQLINDPILYGKFRKCKPSEIPKWRTLKLSK